MFNSIGVQACTRAARAMFFFTLPLVKHISVQSKKRTFVKLILSRHYFLAIFCNNSYLYNNQYDAPGDKDNSVKASFLFNLNLQKSQFFLILDSQTR